jgi:hypothetical protein
MAETLEIQGLAWPGYGLKLLLIEARNWPGRREVNHEDAPDLSALEKARPPDGIPPTPHGPVVFAAALPPEWEG